MLRRERPAGKGHLERQAGNRGAGSRWRIVTADFCQRQAAKPASSLGKPYGGLPAPHGAAPGKNTPLQDHLSPALRTMS